MAAALLLAGASGPVAATAPAPERAEDRTDAAFVGHYYLNGVMETGSELLLRADGSFGWFLSYGAVDQFAHGAWHRDDDTIVLVTSTPPAGKPLFDYLETEPWNDEAEQERFDRQYDEAVKQVEARCPFLGGSAVTTPPLAVSVNDPDAAPVPVTVMQDRAAAAFRDALAARARVEALAKSVMSGRQAALAREGEIDELRQALYAWDDARRQAVDAAMAAKLPAPDLTDPALPAECALPKRDEASPGVTRGIAARVFDLASRQGARDVQVTLHFADGHETTIVTAGRGLAILPGKASAPVIGASLHADYAAERDRTFSFAPVTSGILHFSIDAEQLVPPPFSTMRLRISDQALIPEGLERGRYER